MRIAIVDDDEQQRVLLKGYVERFFSELNQSFTLVCFASSVDFASDYTVSFDIILLDIDMPHMNGIEAAKKIRQVDSSAVILFITNMAQCAIYGYEVNALDFMLKPVGYFNLSVKLARAIKQVPKRKSISLKAEGKNLFLDKDDIYYVEGHNQYVIYHTGLGNLKTHSTLKETETKLQPGFSRCSNSFIVNMRHVTCIDGTDVVVGKERLPISRAHKKSFWEDVNKGIFPKPFPPGLWRLPVGWGSSHRGKYTRAQRRGFKPHLCVLIFCNSAYPC